MSKLTYRQGLEQKSSEQLIERQTLYINRIEELLLEREKIDGAIDTIDQIIAVYSDVLSERETSVVTDKTPSAAFPQE